MTNGKLLAVTLAVLLAPASARADAITVNGTVSLGSSLGLINDGDRKSYAYGGTTRNLDLLMRGCPIKMGETVPCVVKFNANGENVTEIISAAPPSFGGVEVNRPGSVFDAYVCDQPADVDYRGRPGCTHFDGLMVQVLTMNQAVTRLRWNGQIKYALSQRVTINCQGTSISLASYIGKNFPPGIKSC